MYFVNLPPVSRVIFIAFGFDLNIAAVMSQGNFLQERQAQCLLLALHQVN